MGLVLFIKYRDVPVVQSHSIMEMNGENSFNE